jgi:hypothetical protein
VKRTSRRRQPEVVLEEDDVFAPLHQTELAIAPESRSAMTTTAMMNAATAHPAMQRARRDVPALRLVPHRDGYAIGTEQQPGADHDTHRRADNPEGPYWWWIFRSGDNFRTHASNAANRAALTQLYTEIRLGNGYEDVLRTYWSRRTPELRLDAGDPAAWRVAMPGEFGATDWNLVLEFRDGRVTRVAVRTSDGPAPKDAPAEKPSSGARLLLSGAVGTGC